MAGLARCFSSARSLGVGLNVSACSLLAREPCAPHWRPGCGGDPPASSLDLAGTMAASRVDRRLRLRQEARHEDLDMGRGVK
jgi:hypothetical protein